MRPRNRLARLFRALSGETQKDFAERTGVDLSLLARYELDQVEPGLDPLARLAEAAGLTVTEGEQVLRLADTLSTPRRRTGAGIEDLSHELPALLAGTYQRLLRLAPPADPPQAEDREHARELWARLEPLSEDERLAVVRVAQEFQSWALLERVCQESVSEASREAGRAASLARLAQEIAARVRGPEEWRNRLQGFAAAHLATAQGLLDSGRLLDLDSGL